MVESQNSCLSRSSSYSDYSHLQSKQAASENDEQTGLYLYDCYVWIKKRLFPQHVKEEAKALIKLAWGICVNSIFGFIIPLAVVFAVGHKGKQFLAATGLGLSICTLTGNVYVIGVTSVCETVMSQAYGAKQMRRYGVLLQRSIILTFLAILPSCALWINTDVILLKLGQDKEISRLAGQFCIYYIPGIFFYAFYNIFLRYLACQNIVHPSVYGAIIAFIMDGVSCYLFVYHFDMGVRGGALAVGVAYFSFSLVLLFFTLWKKHYKDSWYGWSVDCLCGWKEFIALSAPSIILVASEWLCFEIGVISLGAIGTLEQATQIVLYYSCGFVYFVSIGISIATAVRVGHFLGSGDAEGAKNALRVSLKLVFVVDLFIGLLLISLQNVIGYLFTSDRSVVEEASKWIYLIAIVEIFDGIAAVFAGAIRGLGYQKFGAAINFVSLTCIATLVYLLLIFKAHLGVRGFWIGIILGLICQNISLSILMYKIDWRKRAVSARHDAGVAVEDEHGTEANDGEGNASRVRLVSREKAAEEDWAVVIDEQTSVDDEIHEKNGEVQTPVDRGYRVESFNLEDDFFVHRPPTLSKFDVFLKLTTVSVILLGVAGSVLARFIR